MGTITRRRFVESGLAAGAALGFRGAVAEPHVRPINGGKLAKYLEPVPRPGAGMVVARRDVGRSGFWLPAIGCFSSCGEACWADSSRSIVRSAAVTALAYAPWPAGVGRAAS